MELQQTYTSTLVVQAGGRSSRMGQDKGLVLLNGKPLIEYVLANARPLVATCLITTNSPEDYRYLNIPLASDDQPGAGALPGLRTALQNADGEVVLLIATDMPFVHPALAQHLLTLAGGFDLVVPRWEDRFQTMCAVYRRQTCLHAVEAALAAGKKRMISFYDAINVRTVEPDEVAQFDSTGRSFFNINTPADLEKAQQLLTSRPGNDG